MSLTSYRAAPPRGGDVMSEGVSWDERYQRIRPGGPAATDSPAS